MRRRTDSVVPAWRAGVGEVELAFGRIRPQQGRHLSKSAQFGTTHTSSIQEKEKWNQHFIQKPGKTLVEPPNWRPLCRDGTRFKDYDGLLWTAVPQSTSPLGPLQFSFTPGRQPMDSIEALRTTGRNAKTCGHCLFVASPDVDTAFDQPEAYLMEGDFLEHHAPAWPGKARRAPPPRGLIL